MIARLRLTRLQPLGAHLKEALNGTPADKSVEIRFQDEATTGQIGSLGCVRTLAGSHPPMGRDNRHDTAYIFDTVVPPAMSAWQASRRPLTRKA
jgi:hypothetical protein